MPFECVLKTMKTQEKKMMKKAVSLLLGLAIALPTFVVADCGCCDKKEQNIAEIEIDEDIE